MRLVYFALRHVTPTVNVLAGKSVLVVNVEQNAILVLALQVNYVRTELVLRVAVRIWTVPVIDRVSMDNAWILASEIMPVVRTLCVKYPNTERFVYVRMDSKENQSRDVHHTNVKPMMTVNMTNNVIMDHVKILAYNQALVALMPNVGLSIVMHNALVHQGIMVIQQLNVLHKLLVLVLEIRAAKMQDVEKLMTDMNVVVHLVALVILEVDAFAAVNK